MNNHVHGSWKNTMMTLPDRIFYDLIHNWLGEVADPHKRQTIIDVLDQKLNQGDFQEALLSTLDREDHIILWLVSQVYPIKTEQLFTMAHHLTGIQNYLHFYQRVLSLQDRLWLFQKDHGEGLIITPQLMDLVTKSISPRPNEVQEGGPQTWLSSLFILAMAIFATSPGCLTKQDGSLSKRSKEAFTQTFRGLGDFNASSDIPESLVDIAILGLLRLGLIIHNPDKGGYSLNESRLSSFLSLPEVRVICHFAAAAIHPPHDSLPSLGGPWVLGYNAPGLIQRLATVLTTFMEFLPQGSLIETGSLANVLQCAMAKQGYRNISPDEVTTMVHGLSNLGFLGHCAEEGSPIRIPVLGQVPSNKIPIRCTTAGDFYCYPGTNTHALSLIAPCLGIQRFGQGSTFILNPLGTKKALDGNLDASKVLGILEDLAGEPVPQALKSQILVWEEEQRAFVYQPGMVVQAGPLRLTDLGLLLEEEEDSVEALGPGRWFIPYTSIKILQLLVERGFIPEAELHHALDLHGDMGPEEDVLSLPQELPEISQGSKVWPGFGDFVNPNNQIRHDLLALAQGKPWSPEILEEARSRIFKGLICTSEQLNWAPRPSEKGKAQGLDYNAKVRLIEEAIKQKNEYLALTLLDNNKAPPLMLWPKAIKNKGPDTLLMGLNLPEHKEMTVFVRKIVEVKRIRATIFV